VDLLWQTAGNWSPAGVPQQTDAVTIAANVTVTADASARISFSSLTVGNASGSVTPVLVLSTGIAAGQHVLIRRNATVTQGTGTGRLRVTGDWTMESGSLLNHLDNTGASLTSQVWLDVAGTFDLQAGATVSATGRGYDGGVTNGGQGFGPGKGSGSSVSSGGGSGAGYGGDGGAGDGGAIPGGSAYGSFSDPSDAGSGGGGGDTGSGTNTGGAGGGLIRLSAATMALAGRIEADGSAGGPGAAGDGNSGAGGGGSGGAVSIVVDQLTGGGTIYALGGGGGADTDGADDPGGGGGGGRVALSISQSGTACLIAVSTHGGASGGGASSAGLGGTFSSTSTLPAPALAMTSVSSYSVTWGWNLVSNGQNYQVFDELDGAVSPLLGPTEVEFVEEGLLPNTTYTRTVRVTACGSGTSSADATVATLTSTPTVAAQPFTEVWTDSMTLAWTAFGAGGSQGYRVEASSTDFGVLSPGGLVHSTETTNGLAAALSVVAPPLSPNTTYFFRIAGLNWAGALGPYEPMGSTPTLALPITAFADAETFLSVQDSSVAVAWAARPSAPPDASSMTAQGYVLEASSSNFGALGAGAPLFSSVTYSVLASTLVVDGLDLSNTYYFRVAALNHAGRPNYASLPRLVFSVAQSTDGLELGALDMTVALSTVSQSSMVVVNTGSVPMSFILSADTATVSTPWTLGDSPGNDRAVLQGVWDAGPGAPPHSAFSTVLSSTARLSGDGGSGAYEGGQTGVAVPPGASRTLWFRFLIPASTTSNTNERLRVTVRGVRP
ncbi:MAG: fibronectin type III domain-containing protein, partial [Elusimicrobiota bacterium]|nr:fibronectin type III domain-containing protein [Elusimicrobiota bacterium]